MHIHGTSYLYIILLLHMVFNVKAASTLNDPLILFTRDQSRSGTTHVCPFHPTPPPTRPLSLFSTVEIIEVPCNCRLYYK